MRFLEIRGDPHVARHEHHQGLSGLRVSAFARRDLGGITVDRGLNEGAREVCLGRFPLSLCLIQFCASDLLLGL